MTWEDWKKVQKENAAKAAKLAEDEESQMREYRAQLDADRNAKLSKGTNNAHLRAQVSGPRPFCSHFEVESNICQL